MKLLQEILSRNTRLELQQRLIEVGFDVELTKMGLLIKAVYDGKNYANHVLSAEQDDADLETIIEDMSLWIIDCVAGESCTPGDWISEEEAVEVATYLLDPANKVKFVPAPPDTVRGVKSAMKVDGWTLLADSEDPFDNGVELIFGKKK